MPTLTYKNAILHFEGHSLRDLANDFATPFFLISEERIGSNYEALRRGLTSHGASAFIRYCAKANNEPVVLKILHQLGSDIMVSHLAEADLALQCGFLPEQIAFQQPILSEQEVRGAIALGVRFFHVCHPDDMDLLDRLGKECEVTLHISLRIRNGTSRIRTSPLEFMSRRLGLHPNEILPAAGRILASKNLELAAINFYRGTQLESPSKFRSSIRLVAQLAAQMYNRHGNTLGEINLGGGIPSPANRRLGLASIATRLRGDWQPRFKENALEQFAAALAQLHAQEVHAAGLPHIPSIAVEPGRSIVGDAVILVSRVNAVQGRWLFMDASHNFLAESSLLLSRPILPAQRNTRKQSQRYHLSGSTLNTMDVLDFWRRLPKQQPGDVLAFCGAGAYSISRASRYAGLLPAVYLIDSHGTPRLIRPAEDTTALHASLPAGREAPVAHKHPQ